MLAPVIVHALAAELKHQRDGGASTSTDADADAATTTAAATEAKAKGDDEDDASSAVTAAVRLDSATLEQLERGLLRVFVVRHVSVKRAQQTATGMLAFAGLLRDVLTPAGFDAELRAPLLRAATRHPEVAVHAFAGLVHHCRRSRDIQVGPWVHPSGWQAGRQSISALYAPRHKITPSRARRPTATTPHHEHCTR